MHPRAQGSTYAPWHLALGTRAYASMPTCTWAVLVIEPGCRAVDLDEMDKYWQLQMLIADDWNSFGQSKAAEERATSTIVPTGKKETSLP